MARFLSISSGSNGNCYYIGNERTALVVDAGVGFRTIKQRLTGAGVDISSVEMIFVTHDHVDHIRGLLSLAQRLSVPVYATARLHDALMRHPAVGPDLGGSRRVVRPGVPEQMRGVGCVAFEVPHDATQTLGYFIDFFGTRFVFMTDLGRVPDYALEYCRQADYVVIESNYDVDMLMRGPYPPDLKYRIISDCGHLSNDDCASALRRIWHPGLKGVFLCHLSKDNNTPATAYASAQQALAGLGLSIPEDIQLVCLPRSDVFSVDF
ncbi:MAG TPA: MBL fold metallo-hydrolase [Candidatus Coprenecus stercoravium]|uniref:MBL fold metallo-hydrolase n=1 Tax=Candidatus Coprenecus stercoravium TaxID=2840735 RepID=A0A9D2K9L5_9BACT|nr:MBL fold metallo-hydrolase [Candidatus Coprenecus stercoravium]